MKKLIQFASDRRGTTSAWLRSVLVVPLGGLSDVDSIVALEGPVPVVDIQFGRELQKNLT